MIVEAVLRTYIETHMKAQGVQVWTFLEGLRLQRDPSEGIAHIIFIDAHAHVRGPMAIRCAIPFDDQKLFEKLVAALDRATLEEGIGGRLIGTSWAHCLPIPPTS